MKCLYDPGINCIYKDEEFKEELCRKCPIYEAIIEGGKGCGSVEF